jgi:septum site-determining protein MinC
MKARRAVEIRGSTIPVLQIVVRDCDPQSLDDEMATTVGRAHALLAEAVAVLDLRECRGPGVPPSDALAAVQRAGVRLAAVLVNGRSDEAQLSGAQVPIIDMPLPAGERQGPVEALAGDCGQGPWDQKLSAEASTLEMPPTSNVPASNVPASSVPPGPLYVTQPVRSGQRLYAKGRDLIVLAPTSRGAELIADGSIFAFVPLRGRALAGASGDREACIIATALDAELVAVAGVYRTLETSDLAGLEDSAVRVTLEFSTEGSERLVLGPVGPIPSFS